MNTSVVLGVALYSEPSWQLASHASLQSLGCQLSALGFGAIQSIAPVAIIFILALRLALRLRWMCGVIPRRRSVPGPNQAIFDLKMASV